MTSDPAYAFRALLALAFAGSALLASAAARFLSAGIRAGDRALVRGNWRGILIPDAGDLAIHLIGYLLLALLVAGLLRGTCSLLLQWRRTRRFLAEYRARDAATSAAAARTLARVGARVGLSGSLDLLVSPRPLAFCYGFRRPRVAVTTALVAALDEREFEAVLWHEGYHVTARDPARLAMANVFAATFFFLPLLPILRDHYGVAKELAADRRAVRAMGGERGLAAALCKLLLLAPAVSTPPAGMVGATSYLALRVDALLGEGTPQRPRVPLTPLLWTLAGGALLALLLVIPLTLFTAGSVLLHP